MPRGFLLTAMAAIVVNGCLTSHVCGGEHARTGSNPPSRPWSSAPSDLGGYHLGTNYAPHGWFGYDPTRSSHGWADPCFGLAGRGYRCTYHSEIGTQREPIPLHW
jgi:hypothetical protein